MTHSFLLWVLLLMVGAEDEIVLLNTGVKCTSTQQCIDYFAAERCKFVEHYCLSGACRVEPSVPCGDRVDDATCNSRNHRCQIQLCGGGGGGGTCQSRLCDGEERCIGGRCVFRYLGRGIDNLACDFNASSSIHVDVTDPPSPIPTTAAPTAAPTAAGPVNVQLYVLILIGVMLLVGFVIILIVIFTRAPVPSVGYEDTVIY